MYVCMNVCMYVCEGKDELVADLRTNHYLPYTPYKTSKGIYRTNYYLSYTPYKNSKGIYRAY